MENEEIKKINLTKGMIKKSMDSPVTRPDSKKQITTMESKTKPTTLSMKPFHLQESGKKVPDPILNIKKEEKKD